MTTTRKKKTPAKAASKRAPKSDPVPLTPVLPKVGESAGNLRGRAEAFQRRRGKTQ